MCSITFMMEVVWKTRLRRVLEERGITMKEASMAAVQGKTFVRDILERNRTPSIDKFLALASSLGLKAEQLLTDDEHESFDRGGELTYESIDSEASDDMWDAEASGYTRDHWKPKV